VAGYAGQCDKPRWRLRNIEVSSSVVGTTMTKGMRKAASEAITKHAKARAADLAATIADLQAAGATSLRAIERA
jgi:hypothetical protein